MTTISVIKSNGQRGSLDSETVEALVSRVTGTVLTDTSEEYEIARRVWNAMIDKRPALIVRCTGVSDVMESVKFAREHDLLISIRGGGHSAAGHGTCDGGIVIDTSPMKGVRVDPVSRTAHVQAGLTWAELDAETQVFGLAVTGGTVANTGVAGLTLGGGLGWLMGKHGLTCDNVISIDLVTADGEAISANKDSHPDLFWALRGGGGNFGVVTSFQFQLHEVSQVIGGMIIHPMNAAKDLLTFYRDTTQELPNELEVYAALMTSPDGDPISVLMVGYNGDLASGEKVIDPIRKFGNPLVDGVGPMTYGARQHLLDAMSAYEPRRYWKSGFVNDFSDDLIDVIAERGSNLVSPLTAVPIFNFHGAATRVDPGETAFGHRSHQWDIDIVSQWMDPSDDEDQIGWTRDFWSELEPFAGKTIYVNHISGDEPSRVETAFGKNFAKLRQIKAKYDPDNAFRLNHNIPV